MADNLVASIDGVLVKVGDRIVSLYQDAGVPEGADKAHVKLLTDRGLLVAGPSSAVDDVDGPDGPIPPKSAPKSDWVDYAVAVQTAGGVAEADARALAENLTKEQLIEQYGAA